MPLKPRRIVHLDLDAFFVSVERLLDPHLEGRPVIVGGSPASRGVVASASYEARRFGVRSAQPSAEAARLCPGAIFLPPRFKLYREISDRVMELLREFTPLVEAASVDEAYLDISGSERLFGPPQDETRLIKRRLREELGLPATVALAGSKLVAKIASAQAKPDGFLFVPVGREARFLAPLPVREIPGVGPVAGERLESAGLRTIGDLQRLGPVGLRQILGRSGEGLFERAMGQDMRPVLPDSDRKSLGHEETFERDLGGRAELGERLRRLTAQTAADLWRAGRQARRVELKLRYADFRTLTRHLTLSQPTSDERTLESAALGLLERAWTGRPLRLLGVRVSRLTPGRVYQLRLDDPGPPRAAALEALSQELRLRFGPAAPRRASHLLEENLDRRRPNAHS